ncbi:hypothetical protein FACS1894184_19560 [Clostridia bacterium]|nr:hypothetical protein FACS1894184_19560 [Clostridia bacterium]
MERISLASYSFHKLLSRGMIDVFGYLEATRYRYGIVNADIWNGFLTSYDDDYLKKIREAMDDRGMTLGSLCCDGAHPWADDPDAKKAQDAKAQDCLRAAEILGAKTVRIDAGIREMEPTQEQMDVVTSAFQSYCKRGEEYGFLIGPENHWGASRRLSFQKELAARVNSPAYGILLHLNNWELADGETLDGNDQAVAKLAVHTHVDYNNSPRSCEILPALRDAGYTGLWGVEHHTEVDEMRKVELQLAQVRLAKC